MPRTPAFDRDDVVARALFWEKGWAGTSTRDLSDALDLRPGSLYAAFGSKEGLFRAALDRHAAEQAAALAAAEAAHGPLGALRALLEAAAWPAEGPARSCLLVKTLLETGAGRAPLSARAAELLAEAETRFAAVFARAQAAGEVAARHDPAALARRFQSDLTGLHALAERDAAGAAALAAELSAALDMHAR
ncbi:helix-turn-helix transcriptional regulator [Jannaschia sp. Os4]|uniref:TetR/AcrR family transcriptional regulator n=1 Tax=Jannaschia sp. Os4 TaxID=2807617 RepID=UPI00193A9E43|nr:TetR/AcrR family transcriptional regulator [Jannaschia sp. Os4]MBM2577501.1 helix-turn-helix transcriptional regulator [Jannaschia sp. Os4]